MRIFRQNYRGTELASTNQSGHHEALEHTSCMNRQGRVQYNRTGEGQLMQFYVPTDRRDVVPSRLQLSKGNV